MSRPLIEAGFSLNQLDRRVETLKAGREKFDRFVELGGRQLFDRELNRARDKGGAALAEAVLEVGDRRAAVLDALTSRGFTKVGSRIQEIEDIAKNHPATKKITRIERLQAAGYIGESDAIPAIDYLKDLVPNAPQEENPEPDEKPTETLTRNVAGESCEAVLEPGMPTVVTEPNHPDQTEFEGQRIEALKKEFRGKLESIKIAPIPKRVIEVLIDGGHFDEGSLILRRELALAVYPKKTPYESLGALGYQMNAAGNAIAGVMSIEGRKPEGAKQIGYFLSFFQSSS